MKVLTDHGIATLKQLKEEIQKLAAEEKESNAYVAEVRDATVALIDCTLEHNDFSFWREQKNIQMFHGLILCIVRDTSECTPEVFNQASYQYAKVVLAYLSNTVDESGFFGAFASVVLSSINYKKFVDMVCADLSHKIALYEMIQKVGFDKVRWDAWWDGFYQLQMSFDIKIENAETINMSFDELHQEYTANVVSLLSRVPTFPFLLFPEIHNHPVTPVNFCNMVPFPVRTKMILAVLTEECRLNMLLNKKGCDAVFRAGYDYCLDVLSTQQENTALPLLITQIAAFKKDVAQYKAGTYLKGYGFFSSLSMVFKQVDTEKIKLLEKLVSAVDQEIGLTDENKVLDGSEEVWRLSFLIFRLITKIIKQHQSNILVGKDAACPVFSALLQRYAQDFLRLTLFAENGMHHATLKLALENYESSVFKKETACAMSLASF